MINGKHLRSTLLVLCAIAFVAMPSAAQVDQYAASTKTCESVINDSVKDEFPKAKSIGWDMNSVSENKKSKREVRLKGSGSYKGSSGKKRTYTFECTYDTKDNRVTAASWTSSFDRKQHVVVSGSSGGGGGGASEDEVARACKGPVEREVAEGFPSSVGQLSYLEDTLEMSERGGVANLSGQGRFRGGGGSWHRFEFTCTYDDGEVTKATWKHLGDEKDLD